MKANKVIVVPETHWDREWYLPFQEYRARLVIMLDKLLEILKKDPDYKNFTLDGQTIPLEDYLEVKPQKVNELIKNIKEGRISVGPMYILPDEFLISGESFIRNLLIGHQIAKQYGRVMKAGYIPDPFGHIAQLPQILSGFELPSVLFFRGFGNEFEKQNLDIEFTWNAPGKASSITAFFLKEGYGSVANINTSKKNGKYKSALRKMRRVISKMEEHTASPVVVLNSGSDHHEARPEIPEIIKQWNEEHPDVHMEQNDFEYYVKKVLETKPKLKEFMGELRGGKYAHLLSGVFSARMWIKQRNTAIEYLFEKYTEPFATMTYALDKYNDFEYPEGYIRTGLKWLIKNHPHDSICGCSIDQVHDEMKTRFDWAEQIGTEVFKTSALYLSKLIKIDQEDGERFALIVYNPLPWKRKDIVGFNCVTLGFGGNKEFNEDITIIDTEGNEIEYQNYDIEEEPRYTQGTNISNRFTFIADMPACGYKVYYVVPAEEPEPFETKHEELSMNENSLENEFYKIQVNSEGTITVNDKKAGKSYENVCYIEDVGDWGDEYDYSGPKEDQTDKKFTSEDLKNIAIEKKVDGPSQKTLKINATLALPNALKEDRSSRSDELVENSIEILITLYKKIQRIDFQVNLQNKSKDHRIRALFPTQITTDMVYADGHFYVVPREVDIPQVEGWAQPLLGTNHQKDFVSVQSDEGVVAVINKGLPEYEALREEDGTVTLAITLLRCMEWLSRGDFETRMSNAGPDLNTPGAQEIGEHTFDLSLVIDNNNSNWMDAEIHKKGKEFNNPLKPIIPFMTNTPLRIQDKLVLTPMGVLSHFMKQSEVEKEAYLGGELSFLESTNHKIQLSILKKAEDSKALILRFYNISDTTEKTEITLPNAIEIDSAEIVNFLEQKPETEIKAKVSILSHNSLSLELEPHVIATIKVEYINK